LPCLSTLSICWSLRHLTRNWARLAHTDVMSMETSIGEASAERSLSAFAILLVRLAGMAALLGLATLADFVIWLGWQRTDYVSYQPWQVAGLVLGLGAIAAVSGWRGHPLLAAVVSTIVMTVSFSLQGGATSHADGLFLIGSFMVAFNTSLGVGLVALAADAFARRKSPPPSARSWRSRPWVWPVLGVGMLIVLPLLLMMVVIEFWV